ncbi:HMG-box domain-containing protein [Cladophialophora immunda]|nr:HMG-box domain-containing protein [Cladophialophora immunda]
MTVALPLSRPLTKQLLVRSARSLTRPVSANPLLRVTCHCSSNNDPSGSHPQVGKFASLCQRARTYATASAKPASRPKQHTGRTPAKSTKSTTKKATPKKKRPARKAKKTVATKAKPKVKKPLSKTALLKKARKAQADLRAAALLEEPKPLPSTPWRLVFAEETKKGGGQVKAAATAAAQKFRNLSLEERERYNHEATENKAKNDRAYKQWVQTHSPLEIKLANNARRQLTKKAKAAGKKKQYKSIQDDRSVHRPRNAYAFFFKERNDSGDLQGMTVGERGKLIGQEWKKLSAAEKKTYEDQAQVDKDRYLEEYKTVYGEDPPFTKKKSG